MRIQFWFFYLWVWHRTINVHLQSFHQREHYAVGKLQQIVGLRPFLSGYRIHSLLQFRPKVETIQLRLSWKNRIVNLKIWWNFYQNSRWLWNSVRILYPFTFAVPAEGGNNPVTLILSWNNEIEAKLNQETTCPFSNGKNIWFKKYIFKNVRQQKMSFKMG